MLVLLSTSIISSWLLVLLFETYNNSKAEKAKLFLDMITVKMKEKYQ